MADTNELREQREHAEALGASLQRIQELYAELPDEDALKDHREQADALAAALERIAELKSSALPSFGDLEALREDAVRISDALTQASEVFSALQESYEQRGIPGELDFISDALKEGKKWWDNLPDEEEINRRIKAAEKLRDTLADAKANA